MNNSNLQSDQFIFNEHISFKKLNCEVFQMPEFAEFRESYKKIINYHKDIILATKNGSRVDINNAKQQIKKLEKELQKSITNVKSISPNLRIDDGDMIVQYAECIGDIPEIEDGGTFGDVCQVFLNTFLDCRKNRIIEAHIKGGIAFVTFVIVGAATTYVSAGVGGPLVAEIGTVLFGGAAVGVDFYTDLKDCYITFCGSVQAEAASENGLNCAYRWTAPNEVDVDEESLILDPCKYSTVGTSGN